ncbi:hypothetical protein JYT75_01240, partial [Oceanicaulis sp. AH-315-P02]|nr:hypothetical protein [Oceanicaulis sp. AH-315-P02]
DEKVADNREIKDTLFKGAVAEIRENNPEITNVEICATLLKAPDQIPPTEIAKLQSFVRIQELAATPEDAAIVTAKINNLNFDNGIPDPVLFVQGQIFNDPNLSEASKDAIATELKIPRPTLVTGSDINKAMDAVDAEGNPKYTEKNPLQIRGGVNAYVKPDGSRVARVEVQGVGIREIPWERNERGEYIGLKLSMLKIWAVNEQRGNTDFFGETVNIDNQILSQTDPEKLRKTQQIMEALLGGDAGYDGEVITDEQAEFVSWFAQYVSTKGDAAEGDFDKQAAIENRTNLGIHPNGDITQIDYEVMREAGSFAQGQYGTGSPDYPALQKHLHEMFPEKNIPLTGENKQYDPMADFEEITEFVDDTYQASK